LNGRYCPSPGRRLQIDAETSAPRPRTNTQERRTGSNMTDAPV
jgi:hypothetical protein